LLELITVPMVVIIPKITSTDIKNPLHGIVVGFFGVTLLFYCINRLLGKLNIHLGEYRIGSISIFTSALWSSFILALIFVIQQFLKTVLFFNYPIREIAFGFFSAGGAIFFIGVLYRQVIKCVPSLSILIGTEKNSFIVENYSLLKIALLAGTYEAIALPIILLWMNYPEHQIVAAAFTGVIGGFVGGTMIWLLSALFSSAIGWISLKKLTR
jgi:hypothetical protein